MLGGSIGEWDIENQQWKIYGNREVALKKFENFVNFNDVLNLMNIYELDIVHQNFYPGNILSSDSKNFMDISDFGLIKLIEANLNNPEKKNIFVVLPYIAPEVLSGEKEYTKVADVYSFGIIAYEIVTGFPPSTCQTYHGENKDSEIGIQIKKAEEISANQKSTNTTTTTPFNYHENKNLC
ncbi:hypothetical protein Glove_136g60 [Diversispora epigaea]|uniref:Protein kinase domain-containing protein n=1 Tax=Diversispora epigaea TaxID=1348612 RepID=A0A397IWQ8_9GLOM|nr:hypothetical protein Glove_136g60 [Diversispora epigaea]